EVSLESGRGVAAALIGHGFEIIEGDISPEDTVILDKGGFDVVFPVLHGTFGEDGQLQEILEQRGLIYAGSDAASSRLAMNKYQSKLAFEEAGLQAPIGCLITSEVCSKLGDHEFELYIERAIESVTIPCVVKPNQEGSSIGVVICHNEEEAKQAITETLEKYQECLVEQLICGKELTVGIFGEMALPVIQIWSGGHGFYDYQAKYIDDNTQYLFDINLEPAVLERVKSDGLQAFKALNCRDFGRVDMIVDDYGRDFLLEVNTIPGFTSHSLLPKAGCRVGISMEQMCGRIIQMAYERSI
ncbi:MAG: D-alanine--D-alanine ligase, partial [Planctomycetes bacterium]|nr:D-alanine--D-alanine ligase [Planctomycetota bacterium]